MSHQAPGGGSGTNAGPPRGAPTAASWQDARIPVTIGSASAANWFSQSPVEQKPQPLEEGSPQAPLQGLPQQVGVEEPQQEHLSEAVQQDVHPLQQLYGPPRGQDVAVAASGSGEAGGGSREAGGREIVLAKRPREGSAEEGRQLVEPSGPPKPACAACKFLRRRCHPNCLYANYFPPEQPLRFANVHRVFGASNVQKLLLDLPEVQREDAVNTLVYEADARIKDPIYGCVGIIRILQQQIAHLHADLANVHAQLAAARQLRQVQVPTGMGSQPPTPGPGTPLQGGLLEGGAAISAALYGGAFSGMSGGLGSGTSLGGQAGPSLGGHLSHGGQMNLQQGGNVGAGFYLAQGGLRDERRHLGGGGQ